MYIVYTVYYTVHNTLYTEQLTQCLPLCRFGDDMNWFESDDELGSAFNTLAREDRGSVEGETHDYLLKLVRTEVYDDSTEEDIYPYQYTYTHRHFVGK